LYKDRIDGVECAKKDISNAKQLLNLIRGISYPQNAQAAYKETLKNWMLASELKRTEMQ
jgi:hypothetical protein